MVSVVLKFNFFSLDQLVTKNQLLNTKCQQKFLLMCQFEKKKKDSLSSSLFELKWQQKLWLTLGILYLVFSHWPVQRKEHKWVNLRKKSLIHFLSKSRNQMPELESGSKKNTAELNKRDIEKMEEGRDQKWQLRKMMSFCIVGHLKVS